MRDLIKLTSPMVLLIDRVSTDICQAISAAAKKTIPRGSVKKYKPFFSKELNTAIIARQHARK